MHLVCQKHYSCTNTKSIKIQRQVLLGYELHKHLAATVLGGLLLLYLIVLAQQNVEIADKKLQKILNRY